MISMRQNHRTISSDARIGMRRCILVVAQQVELRARIARVLQSAGYAVELAESQKRALELAAGGQIEAAIIVLSTDLASLSEKLRDKVPRTILLGHQTDEGIRQNYSLQGAIAPLVQALDEQKLLDQLGRATTSPGSAGGETAPAPVLKIKDCKFDLCDHTFIDGNGREVHLTRAESALLAAFVANPCRVLSRDQLRRAVVGHGAEPYDRNVDMLIARLRRKIEPNPKAPGFILTVPGLGYKFAPRPQSVEDGESLPAMDLERPNEAQTTWLNRSGLNGVKATSAPGQAGSPHSESGRRQVSVLSCGLIGSTALAVNLDPEDFDSTICRFQDICTSVITRWGGAVTNSVGDEIVAVFGYPRCDEDDAERAVHAGLDLLADASELLSPSAEPLQARIAIATGLVLVGEDQRVVGEPVVTAGRLRNKTPPNSLTITASTRKLLGNMFIYDNLELCEIDRLSEPLTPCLVTGKRAVESRFAARRTGKLTQLVGRQNELQQLSTLWERTKGGKGQVALLCGEAGIGKSRVYEDWLESITDEPHVTMRFQCSPHHTNSPFYPIINQIEHVARFEREDTPEIKIKKLETVLSQAGPATLADIPFFASLLSIPTGGFYSSPNLTPQRQRDLQITALLRQVLGLALTRPVVVKIADAHWMDSSTLELLTRTITSIKTARVFVICSFRPEFFPRWLDESHVTILRLDRLSREKTGVIISDIAGGKQLPRELHEQIMSKVDGIPLFAEELTKTVLESGVLQDEGDQYVAVDPVPSLAIPATLLGSLTARLDRLGPSKEIAQIGAAIGREFSYRLIAAVAPAGGLPLTTALAHLCARELVFVRGEPPDSTYIFKHALVQDAAYATITRCKRQLLHSRIADALVERFPESVETQPELIAHHLAQAGLTERAIEYLRKAGRRAIERSANAEAIRHLTGALESLQSLSESPERKRAALELQVMLGQAMIVDRGYAAPETRETLLRAKTLIDDLTDPSQKFAALYGIWACHYVGGEVAKQRETAVEFLAEAERYKDTAALCTAYRILGTTCVTMGEFAAGLHHLERARELYDAEHHSCYRYGQDMGVAALCYLSWALWHLGNVDQASEVAAEAMKHAEELSHPHTLVYTICHARGFMDLFRRRCEDTQLYAGLVVSLCTENGFSHWVNCGRILEGWAEICRGEVDQGIELLRAGVVAWQTKGARLWLPIFLTLEAEACAKAGLADAALQAIEEAHTISRDSGERWALAEVLRVKARLLLATGRAQVDEIETILVNSLEIARQQQARCWELRASCDLARLWQGQGREKKALKLLQSVYDQFTEGLDTAELREAKALIRSLRKKLGGKQSACAGKVRQLTAA
jgi:predicted ATPase/DNA-binding response OmpR family regulator/class 3 adenylate cyclase